MSSITQGITGDAGERRIVTVLFADLVSSTNTTLNLDTEDAQALLDSTMAAMASAIRRFGGFVIRYQGDGVMASFGAPKSAEDHALRACFAGLAIQEAFQSDGAIRDKSGNLLRVRVGLHSGLVITRNLESDVGSGLDIAGPSVSVAAMAEKICVAGAVTTTSVTAELAGEFLSTRPVTVSDRDIPGLEFVEVLDASLDVQRDRGQNQNPVVFVGREDEEAALINALDQLDSGGRTMCILGDAGIGKSRLAKQIAIAARKRQMPVYLVRGFSLTSATPYLPMHRLLHELLELPLGAEASAIARSLVSVGLEDALRSPLKSFLCGDEAYLQKNAKGKTQDRNLVTGLLVKSIGSILGTTRAVVIVEDLHFLDSETLYCLRQISAAATSTKTLFLFTARYEVEEAVNRLASDKIDLPPLIRPALQAIVESLSPAIAATENIANELIDRSGGVPFVLEQLLHTLGSPGDGIDVRKLPHKVESLVHTRLYQLSQHAKVIAQKLSILGDEFEYNLAASFLDDATQLDDNLAELRHAGFIDSTPGSTIRFKHSIIRESCLNSLILTERRPLHAKAIDALEQQYKNTSTVYEWLAYHAEQAQRDDLALNYFWQACKHAAQQSAVHSLGVIYDRAIACCERLGTAAESTEVDLVLLAFDAMQQHGKINSVVPRLQRTADLAQKLQRTDKQCLALTHLSTVMWFQAKHKPGCELAENAVRLARQNDSLPAQFYSQFTLANLRHGCGDIRGAAELLSRVADTLTGDLEMAYLGAIGLPSVMSRGFLGWYEIELGSFDSARTNIDKACAIAVRADRPYTTVIANVSRGRWLNEYGSASEACDVLSAARELCLKHRIFAMEPVVTGILAAALCTSGDKKRALKITSDSIAKGFFRNSARITWYFLFSGYAKALAANGRNDEAKNTLQRMIDGNEKTYDPSLLAQSCVAMGTLLLSTGDKKGAQCAFERALQIATTTHMLPTTMRAHRGLSACLPPQSEPSAAHKQASQKLSRELGLDPSTI